MKAEKYSGLAGKSFVFLVFILIICGGEIIVSRRGHVRHVGVVGVVVAGLDRSRGSSLSLFPLSWSQVVGGRGPASSPSTAVSHGVSIDAGVGRRGVRHVDRVGGGLVREHVCGGHLDRSVRQEC